MDNVAISLFFETRYNPHHCYLNLPLIFPHLKNVTLKKNSNSTTANERQCPALSARKLW
jgi:hypothetical protein